MLIKSSLLCGWRLNNKSTAIQSRSMVLQNPKLNNSINKDRKLRTDPGRHRTVRYFSADCYLNIRCMLQYDPVLINTVKLTEIHAVCVNSSEQKLSFIHLVTFNHTFIIAIIDSLKFGCSNFVKEKYLFQKAEKPSLNIRFRNYFCGSSV